MELSLVEISPKSGGDGKPDAAAPTLAFNVDVAPVAPVTARTAAPAPATSEIELVAVGAKRALIPVSEGAAAAAAADPLMAEALRDYQNGNIDLPLWSRAIAQHEGDQPQAVAAYLQARATVLKLERRQRRSADPGPPVAAAIPMAHPPAPGFDDDRDQDLRSEAQERSRALRKYAVMAAPVVVALVIGVWWMVSANERDSAQASRTVAAPAVPASAATPLQARAAKDEDQGAYFAGKILDLKSAGNWNVLVLFASEWTRKQPNNAIAWKELSVGYSNMRQHADALEAGTKAAQLAPAEPVVWRNLAQVNLDLNEREAAVKAFERAAALDPTDMFSQLQIGTLNAQLDRLPQARAAFEQVLAADPDNADALCGTASIAQRQGRGKDADSIAQQLRGTDRKCRELASVVAAAPRK